jgi:hypothetical protein
MQYLDLIREACAALGIEGISDTVVENENPFTKENYAKADARLKREAVPSKSYEKAKLRWARKRAAAAAIPKDSNNVPTNKTADADTATPATEAQMAGLTQNDEENLSKAVSGSVYCSEVLHGKTDSSL